MPGITLGDRIPNLAGNSTLDHLKLYDYIGDHWAIIFSHPADFTPVCTTELGSIARYIPEFEKRNVKIIGVSNDSVEDHKAWIKDIEAYNGVKITYPILEDPNREITSQLNMLDPDEKDEKGRPLPSRALHIIGPEKTIKCSFLYPGTTGRNFEEVIRSLDSLLLASKKKIATPANWKPGQPVLISPSVTDEEAKKMFKTFDKVDLPSGKGYIRFTTDV
ncbi:hypothetical protein GOP47_0005212 [Adiantum capillus-veneris]|uniref:Peroxiredoxin n=1 Tax=Adiantum capillus-veneris TaxID=13818 RepID=A0A9D4ZL64_ADICA|nr:hypothetical protein GOP47_0005212 [Adiantum capillus-veneris]